MNMDFIIVGLDNKFIVDKIEEIKELYKCANILLVILYISCFYYSLVTIESFLLYLVFVQLMCLINKSSLLFNYDSDLEYLNNEINILKYRNFANIYYNNNKVTYELYNGILFESILFNNIVISPEFNYNRLDLENKTVEIVDWQKKWENERNLY